MASAEAPTRRLRVEVVYSPAAGEVWQWNGELPEGASLRAALQASGIAEAHPALDVARAAVGVWGRRCGLDEPLRDGDRVEIYRPLKVDPKEARRLRDRRQRAARTRA
jgi:putative ubiquitin-RnfH superfamily antitoxin RatB of RatAB toxin-antitoxin module